MLRRPPCLLLSRLLVCLAVKKKTQIGFTEDDLKQSWVLTKVDGKDVKTAEPRITPTMAIDTDLKIAGFSGCNRFFWPNRADRQ